MFDVPRTPAEKRQVQKNRKKRIELCDDTFCAAFPEPDAHEVQMAHRISHPMHAKYARKEEEQ